MKMAATTVNEICVQCKYNEKIKDEGYYDHQNTTIKNSSKTTRSLNSDYYISKSVSTQLEHYKNKARAIAYQTIGLKFLY